MEDDYGKVENIEWILNGYLNLITLNKQANNPLLAMALEQIKNGLGEEHTAGLD